MENLLYDLKICRNNTKGAIFILAFRTSSFFAKSILLKIIGFPIRMIYKILIQWVFGIDIPDTTVIGRGFQVFHGQGLVINENTIILNNVTVRQNTTIGNTKPGGPSPIIESNVEIGANCVVIGNINIGSNSIIGAGTVVVKSIPANSIVVGQPGKIIKQI
ncbi:serine O-acetyltransferase [Dyadobacter subterraneus]|uniref:Serine acetyltransferase n=1 Tax=Dyadobacter subterraneus TaxID=2773304 RepID=A0ABR9WMF7_9BACT|nr:serine acetyltransferase [Dyadobacter subterraneus]MBE9466622.1 serine acetyltransferase [Dyadobacter subterraneus]